MPFQKKNYADIRDKLNQEQAMHNGFDYRDFDMFQTCKVPVAVQMRLMGVGSANTIKAWVEQRKALLQSA